MTAAPFDPVAAWAELSSEQQAAIGAAALAMMIGNVAAMAGRPGGEAAAHEGELMLELTIRDALPALLDNPPRVDLTAMGIRACRNCGCTDRCACPEGCYWVEPDLCSACAGAGE